MTQFPNARIYKITCDSDPSLIYFGCTTQASLSKVKYDIKRRFVLLPALFDCATDVQFTLIEAFPCNTRLELELRRRFHESAHEAGLSTSELQAQIQYEKEELAKANRRADRRVQIERGKRIVTCAFCKCDIKHNSIGAHEKTKKHLKNRTRAIADCGDQQLLPYLMSRLNVSGDNETE